MFSLATLRVGQLATPALKIGDRFWALTDVAPQPLQPQSSRGLMNVFENWSHAEGALLEVVQGLQDAHTLRHAAAMSLLQH